MITALALMEMESLNGINLFFLVAQERLEEAPYGTIEKKVYDGELVMHSRKKLLLLDLAQNDGFAIYNGLVLEK
ncbi:hypothetical protein [Flavobacterium taihuense]|uniref:Uncharacterized protein n=1 Tax=Flavobacterium taihuense TaxID=2857508 RepID=A0ABS6XTM0_9FLAO|nr:hypothetical protein [Flavobacterium taihuense]MBW4360025.1 hypothetical protein [Flavobacterium taihuense]